ncbi:MAG: enoyl-ACP reductase [Planctomycetota bacterium]|nr:MAG: enoyl-ACP reductase [Planctomycetota bacterium]
MLAGKKGLIFGVANRHSLAWHIAQAARAHGAELLLGVAGERFRERVAPLAEQLDAGEPVVCDVSSDRSIASAFRVIGERMPAVDFLVHAIAFAQKEDLEGRLLDTERVGYHVAHDISAYSLIALAREAEPLLRPGASILTLTYIGSQRAVPNYNIMGLAKASLEAGVRYLASELGPGKGVRVNAISAGPIKTLSASGVKGLREKLHLQAEHTPLRRAIRGEDVGKAGVFLLSDYASGVTGEVLYVDNGYHAVATWA